jgi:hypothetical protein
VVIPGRDPAFGSLDALKNIIAEVDLILETMPDLPQNRTGRSRELLHTALAITDDLISENRKAENIPRSSARAQGRKRGRAAWSGLSSRASLLESTYLAVGD